jgi:hypothetical protein
MLNHLLNGQTDIVTLQSFLPSGLRHDVERCQALKFDILVGSVYLVHLVYLVGLVYLVDFVYFVDLVDIVCLACLLLRYLMRPEMIIAVLLASEYISVARVSA